MTSKDRFLDILKSAIIEGQLSNLLLANKRNPKDTLKSVHIKQVLLKKGERLSFVFRYQTKDITKNYIVEEAVKMIGDLLEDTFYQANLFTESRDVSLDIKKNGIGTIKSKTLEQKRTIDTNHDHQKARIISANRPFLHALGISSSSGKIKKDKQSKYRQINRFIELMQDAMHALNITEPYHIVDMGSGKAYLTFAVYDYITQVLGHDVSITGVEMRKALVDQTNQIAKSCDYEHLKFIEGTIQENTIAQMDIMMALHACDTATDDAIAQAIQKESRMIICSPCCHKQIRKQMKPSNALQNITKHGILKERQAELVTDTLRAMILEAYGYATKIIEFVNTEHTPKNLLIIATRNRAIQEPDLDILREINKIKNQYGIQFHYLEKLLGLYQVSTQSEN